MSTFKPFHESIVDAIKRADDLVTMSALAILINETKIPKDHDIIIKAWETKLIELRMTEHPNMILSESVNSQKLPETVAA